jgi:hypothetical protein
MAFVTEYFTTLHPQILVDQFVYFNSSLSVRSIYRDDWEKSIKEAKVLIGL